MKGNIVLVEENIQYRTSEEKLASLIMTVQTQACCVHARPIIQLAEDYFWRTARGPIRFQAHAIPADVLGYSHRLHCLHSIFFNFDLSRLIKR